LDMGTLLVTDCRMRKVYERMASAAIRLFASDT
jgi:hypothetical protein